MSFDHLVEGISSELAEIHNLRAAASAHKMQCSVAGCNVSLHTLRATAMRLLRELKRGKGNEKEVKEAEGLLKDWPL